MLPGVLRRLTLKRFDLAKQGNGLVPACTLPFRTGAPVESGGPGAGTDPALPMIPFVVHHSDGSGGAHAVALDC